MRLLEPDLRGIVERTVSAHLRRPWQVHDARDLVERSSHPAALLSDGDFAVFVKLSDAANGAEQFELEVAGLRLLRERGGVRTPEGIGIEPLEAGALLIMRAEAEVPRGPAEWRAIGATLAQLHGVTGAAFGLDFPSYFGPLRQDNTPRPDWSSFYVERRLRPNLAAARAAGNLPTDLIAKVERLAERVPALVGPVGPPALLHGDAQSNNFISTAAGAVVIDPAVCYGHPEYDLALVDYFQPVPPELWAGYRAVRAIDPGFAERRDLWRVAAWLAVVSVSGADYVPQLRAAVEHYV